MASISNQQAKDDSLNLKLSLKINNQLQALFEDTLLKNITLKVSRFSIGQRLGLLANNQCSAPISCNRGNTSYRVAEKQAGFVSFRKFLKVEVKNNFLLFHSFTF